MARVYVTHGMYAGRFLEMEDEEASKAVSGGFALEAEENPTQEAIDKATSGEDANPDALANATTFFQTHGQPDQGGAQNDQAPKADAKPVSGAGKEPAKTSGEGENDATTTRRTRRASTSE